MIKFKIDENLPVEASTILTNAGHDAVTVVDQDLGGSTDLALPAVCQREEEKPQTGATAEWL